MKLNRTVRQGSATIEITGVDELLESFDEFRDIAKKEAKKAVFVTAQQIRTTAIRSIQEHRSKGKESVLVNGHWLPRVWVPEGKGRRHFASTPGNPPNTRDGRLVGSIQVRMQGDGYSAEVGSNLDYAYYLEFGTTRIAERPWLQPAITQNTSGFVDRLRAAINKAIKDAGF